MVCKRVRECSEKECKLYGWCQECRLETNNINVSCSERGKKYNVQNPKKVAIVKFRIDGGIVRDEKDTCKCDYLYCIKDKENPTTIFVELKGKNVCHALEQIQYSLSMFSKEFDGTRKLSRIICGSVPKMSNDSKAMRIRKQIKQQYNAELLIRENKFDELYF